MAGRQYQPTASSNRATRVAVFVAAAVFSLPALASPPHKILCSESDEPNLDVPVEALTSEIVSHNVAVAGIGESEAADDSAKARTRILEPRARAAIQEAFSEVEVVSDETPAEIEKAEEEEIAPRIINTRLPGISEERMDRYKRQMYRRDI